jgi:hypothetical protein
MAIIYLTNLNNGSYAFFRKAVVLLFLIGIGETRAVEAQNLPVWEPSQFLTKVDVSGVSKNIFVMNGAPYPKGAALSVLDILDIGIIDVVLNRNTQNPILPRAYASLTDLSVWRDCEGVVCNQIMRNDVALRRITNFIGWSFPVVENSWHTFKPDAFSSLLIDRAAHNNGKIRSQFALGCSGLLVSDENQPSGKERKQDSGKSSYSDPVLIGKIPQAIPIETETSMKNRDSGRLIGYVAGSWILAIVAYAMLKALRR